MTYKDAYEILGALDRNKLSRKLVRLTKEAINKQVPKPPDNLNEDTWSCPNCGKSYETEDDYYYYCSNCGQAIDWSMYEEDE